MSLVYLAYRKRLHYPLMRSLTRERVLFVERTFVLIYHDAVLFERLVAVAVKFAREQSLARPERIGAVHYYQVVFVLAAADETQSVAVHYAHSRVVERTGRFGKKPAADLHYLLVYFDQIDMLYIVVTAQLPDRASVAAADDQHSAHAGVYRHCDVSDHLVIDEFVLLREHHIAVEHKKSAEFGAFEYVYPLIVAVPAVKLSVYPYRQFYVLGMLFGKPKIHIRLTP